MLTAAQRLAESNPPDDLVPAIVDYQANVGRHCASDRRHLDINRPRHLAMLDEVAQHAPLASLGIEVAEIDEAFGDGGLLSLKALLAFASRKGDLNKVRRLKSYSMASLIIATQILDDQAGRPESKRCAVLRASNEVLEAISEQFGFAAAEGTSFGLDPILLNWQRVHAMALKVGRRPSR